MVTIQLLTLEQTKVLRSEMLGLDRTEGLSGPTDDLPETFHLGAVGDGGLVVGTSTYFPAVCPYEPDVANAYMLRWMVVASDHRGQGIGALIISGAIELLKERGVALMWANARDTALMFYLSNGFSEIPGSGFGDESGGMPHTVVVRRIDE